MHILLTDLTVCPRCGPPFGLILLVDVMAGRRVVSGALACSNCRERYPIEDFVADFTAGAAVSPEAALGSDRVQRLAALAGVTSGPAWLLLLGGAAGRAAEFAELVPEVEIVAAGASADAAQTSPGSVVRVGEVLPFHAGKFAAVVLTGADVAARLAEAARVLRPGGRLVVEPPVAVPADAGLRVVAEDGTTMVCVRA